MSILNKNYEISVWEDRWDSSTSTFKEKRVCTIGSNKMTSQCRVLEPNLVRNVNGTKTLSFNMYRYFKDTITGEQIENPFIKELYNERKIKLEYNEKWYDFIIKNVNENSSTYLYTYQLEDALVQELSKNGFNVTLDEALMNNIGSAKILAEDVLSETDWHVESEVFVQTVNEALIYVQMPNTLTDLDIYHLIDQVEPYNAGVTNEKLTDAQKNELAGKTVLAFYSCCKNKPHRFQFIYNDNGYVDSDGKYLISRKDDRSINESNCQYYIDFLQPETDYTDKFDNNTLNLFLPNNFAMGSSGVDSALSSRFRGNRYGFAQQAVYVPVLEKYCQKFYKKELIPLVESETLFVTKTGGNYTNGDLTLEGCIKTTLNKDEKTNHITSIDIQKAAQWVGLQLRLPDYNKEIYRLKYCLTITGGKLTTIGGHNTCYKPLAYLFTIDGQTTTYTDDTSYIDIDGKTSGSIDVEIIYEKRTTTDPNADTYLYIQPNRATNEYVACELTNISLTIEGDYLGYTDVSYVSPTFVQNCITGYNFETTSGWIATANSSQKSNSKAKTQALYGRFETTSDGTKFSSMTDDFYAGLYESNKSKYSQYLEFTLFDNNQFLLNSGIKDNRALIENMPEQEEWVLDYKILNASGSPYNDNFSFALKEFVYNIYAGGHSEQKGHVTFVTREANDKEKAGLKSGYSRKIFTVTYSDYDASTFKKDSKIYLQIKPIETISSATTYYIQGISLYRKSYGSDEKIIVPNEEVKDASGIYVDTGKIEYKYHYFNQWLVNPDNIDAIAEADLLKTSVFSVLDYTIYSPVYNTGAEKIRTVSAKESNYFNILQNIAGTFEAWLDLEIERNDLNEPGKITKKIAKFKNYIGKNNYANFRYGVNLKDIVRTLGSKNIVTKLIVKQNANELAQDGICTIQRAGANESGENYIYDFQYYQNMDIMPATDYLQTNYYLEYDSDGNAKAVGQDAELWTGSDANKVRNDGDNWNLHGYFLRLKKINEQLLNIGKTYGQLQTEFSQKKAELEVAKTAKEAAETGIEETRDSFQVLTGILPEDVQDGAITKIEIIDGTFEKQDEWWQLDTSRNGFTNGIKIEEDNIISIAIKLDSYKETCHAQVKGSSGSTMESSIGGAYKVTKNGPWEGLYLEEEWEAGREYTLEYDIKVTSGTIGNFGGHNHWFEEESFSIVVTNSQGSEVGKSSKSSICTITNGALNTVYHIKARGRYRNDGSAAQDKNLWIQPNRGETGDIVFEVSNIKLMKTITSDEAVKSFDRPARFSVKVKTFVKNGTSTEREYSLQTKILANTSQCIVQQAITAVDKTRPDIQKYIGSYTTYQEQLDRYTKEIATLEPIVKAKEASIKSTESRQKTLLDYKIKLNNLFFNKYSQFIQEGTWINEEYVDDDKYYADAQSVLYNSCYPQVAYSINVLSMKGIPGYELIDFDLGDKTFVIDKDFFGSDEQVEVVITELMESLDDPSKNTIKVQNFKNQFQDLFQKITATVQQTQYNVGSYEKGAAFLEASAAAQNEFITNALTAATTYLSPSLKHDVVWDDTGITVTDRTTPTNQIRIVGGAILLSSADTETGEQKWKTGITSEGISADLITTGKLNAGVVQIMAGEEATFRWDAYGISAYDATWTDANGTKAISGVNSKRFVRFDKHGLYGINNVSGIDGASWTPNDINDIDTNATFAITWEGLKVTQSLSDGKQATARIGNLDKAIIKVNNGTTDTFVVDDSGNVTVRGNLYIGNSNTSVEDINKKVNEAATKAENAMPKISDKNNFCWSFDTSSGLYMWDRDVGSATPEKAIFSIYGTDVGYHLSLTGEVYATSGSFKDGTFESCNINNCNIDQCIITNGQVAGFKIINESFKWSNTVTDLKNSGNILYYLSDELQDGYNEVVNDKTFGALILASRNDDKWTRAKLTTNYFALESGKRSGNTYTDQFTFGIESDGGFGSKHYLNSSVQDVKQFYVIPSHTQHRTILTTLANLIVAPDAADKTQNKGSSCEFTYDTVTVTNLEVTNYLTLTNVFATSWSNTGTGSSISGGKVYVRTINNIKYLVVD